MRLLTGNDLLTGAVAWWTGAGWSPRVADAAPVGDDAADVLAREEAAGRITAGYAAVAEPTPAGPRPATLKDRIRAAGGPTIAFGPEAG